MRMTKQKPEKSDEEGNELGLPSFSYLGNW
jgi:hypothetical protein